ncbi:MAG: sulfurtransferase [Pseudomonadales bacterium]|nr:sulfurtransferase [Pseudomonadales bacterium]NIX08414.1 sulfurtransferase [Pseudomonadales bacterium]
MEYARPELIEEPAALAERLGKANLRIVDATVFLVPGQHGYRAESGAERFDQGHIPGAVFMDLIDAFSDTTTGLGFSLPDPGIIADGLGRLGISNDSEVVVYSTGHLMWATRAWWLLRYVGHQRASVLNGGFDAWRALDLPVDTGTTALAEAAYQPRPVPSLFTDLGGMLRAMDEPGVCTVNALSAEVYAGTGAMSYGRPGHIPGSVNVHYEDLLADGRFKPAGALSDALQAKGVLDADRVVTYCGGGIAATLDGFACQLLGRDDVAVYDGSMSEWARDPSLPLTVGEAP